MRLWSLHPKYLDRQGLLAVWRESLLAQAVLAGKTRGYRNHPQLTRFKSQADPLDAVGFYLLEIHEEAGRRGYHFAREKILRVVLEHPAIAVMQGQIDHEWQHLMQKLKARSPQDHQRSVNTEIIDLHPLFVRVAGGIEAWEKI